VLKFKRKFQRQRVKMDIQQERWKIWTGLIWLRTGTVGGLLLMR